MKIAIIGAGWYGCHIALALKKLGYEVLLFEKNGEIFSQLSSNFGIRLHVGPHYPRSEETRKNCRSGLNEFKKRYPNLVVEHDYSIYGLGKLDADGLPSRINKEQFLTVCRESSSCREVDLTISDYRDLESAVDVDEPSIMVGASLRTTFIEYLQNAEIPVIVNCEVNRIEQIGSQFVINSIYKFDKIINATSYQQLLPSKEEFPFDIEIVYQPCLGLMYEDKFPGKKPFSLIMMDGWYPCIMPICDDALLNQYILTHGKWTIMGSYDTPTAAKNTLKKLNNTFVETNIKIHAESEMKRFWPAFSKRFKYIGWKGEVLAKLKTKKEFRSAITFERNEIIYVIPGKISNIFDVEREIIALLGKSNILKHNNVTYVKNGVLDCAHKEITDKPRSEESYTCNLQTYEKIADKLDQESPFQIISNYYFALRLIAELLVTASLFGLVIMYSFSFTITSAAFLAWGLSTYSIFSNSPEVKKEDELARVRPH